MINNFNKIIILIIIVLIIYFIQQILLKENFIILPENYVKLINKFNTAKNNLNTWIPITQLSYEIPEKYLKFLNKNNNNKIITLHTNSFPYHSYGRNNLNIKYKKKYFNYNIFNSGINTDKQPIITPNYIIGYALNGVMILNSGINVNSIPNTKIKWPIVIKDNKQLTYNAAGYYKKKNGMDKPFDINLDFAGGNIENGLYYYRDFSFMTAWKTGNGNFYNDNTTKIGAELNIIPYYKDTHYKNMDNARHPDGHSKIIGFAIDGYPIYGPYGYIDCNHIQNNEITDNLIKPMMSSYKLKKNWRNGTLNGIENIDWFKNKNRKIIILKLGIFVEDWEFIKGSGDLDEHNGRLCNTPDFPEGTYAYFASIDSNNNSSYPYFIGNTFYGYPS